MRTFCSFGDRFTDGVPRFINHAFSSSWVYLLVEQWCHVSIHYGLCRWKLHGYHHRCSRLFQQHHFIGSSNYSSDGCYHGNGDDLRRSKRYPHCEWRCHLHLEQRSNNQCSYRFSNSNYHVHRNRCQRFRLCGYRQLLGNGCCTSFTYGNSFGDQRQLWTVERIYFKRSRNGYRPVLQLDHCFRRFNWFYCNLDKLASRCIHPYSYERQWLCCYFRTVHGYESIYTSYPYYEPHGGECRLWTV